MPPLDQIIVAGRLGVLAVWSMIVLAALPQVGQLFLWRGVNGDLKRAALAMVGLGLITYQVRGLVLPPRYPGDFWGIFALSQMLSAGIIVIIVWSLRAPDGHKRAALLSHLGVVAISLVAGLCFSQ